MSFLNLFIVVLFFSVANAFAGAGTTAASFLEIDGGAHSAAMSSAYTAVYGDSISLHHNPAGLAFLNMKESKISRLSYLEEMKLHAFSYAHPLGKNWTVALGGTYLTSGDIEKRDINGNLTGSYSYYGFALGPAVSRKITENFSAGLAAKFIKEGMDDQSASAQALDVGLLYKMENFSVGFAVKNFGTESKMYQESFPLPSEIRGGVSAAPIENLLLTADLHKVKDVDTKFGFGAEYRLRGDVICDWFSIRAGYKPNPETNTGQGLSGGVGLIFAKQYIVEYTFAPYGDFGTLHWFSLGIKFGRKRSAPKTYKPKQKKDILISPQEVKEAETLPSSITTNEPSVLQEPAVETATEYSAPKKPASSAIRESRYEPRSLGSVNTALDKLMRKYQNGEISWDELVKASRQMGKGE